MRACDASIAELLPQAHPMVLLDSVLGWEPDRLEAAVTIRADSPFYHPGLGVPAHVGLEYMAQACGALSGIEARLQTRPVRIGYLLGTRRFLATVAWFPQNTPLVVRISTTFRDVDMGVFDCVILSGGRDLAKAQLTVYQPADAEPIRG
jgi:predicted hotdog family 3-hydroxylacyl-ACP dehydratase